MDKHGLNYEQAERPEITNELQAGIDEFMKQTDWLMSAPTGKQCTYIGAEVMKMFATMPYANTKDEAILATRLDTWCEYLEGYPLYAVVAARDHVIDGKDEMPSINKFKSYCDFFLGQKMVRARDRLTRLLNNEKVIL